MNAEHELPQSVSDFRTIFCRLRLHRLLEAPDATSLTDRCNCVVTISATRALDRAALQPPVSEGERRGAKMT
jgi:hypothetical protein